MWLCGLGRRQTPSWKQKNSKDNKPTETLTGETYPICITSLKPEEPGSPASLLHTASALLVLFEHLPYPVSVILAQNGHVILQNRHSVDAWGKKLGEPLLPVLFRHHQDALSDADNALSSYGTWRGLLRVAAVTRVPFMPNDTLDESTVAEALAAAAARAPLQLGEPAAELCTKLDEPEPVATAVVRLPEAPNGDQYTNALPSISKPGLTTDSPEVVPLESAPPTSPKPYGFLSSEAPSCGQAAQSPATIISTAALDIRADSQQNLASGVLWPPSWECDPGGGSVKEAHGRFRRSSSGGNAFGDSPTWATARPSRLLLPADPAPYNPSPPCSSFSGAGTCAPSSSNYPPVLHGTATFIAEAANDGNRSASHQQVAAQITWTIGNRTGGSLPASKSFTLPNDHANQGVASALKRHGSHTMLTRPSTGAPVVSASRAPQRAASGNTSNINSSVNHGPASLLPAPAPAPSQQTNQQAALLNALTTSAWGTMMASPRGRRLPRRTTSVQMLAPSLASALAATAPAASASPQSACTPGGTAPSSAVYEEAPRVAWQAVEGDEMQSGGQHPQLLQHRGGGCSCMGSRSLLHAGSFRCKLASDGTCPNANFNNFQLLYSCGGASGGTAIDYGGDSAAAAVSRGTATPMSLTPSATLRRHSPIAIGGTTSGGFRDGCPNDLPGSAVIADSPTNRSVNHFSSPLHPGMPSSEALGDESSCHSSRAVLASSPSLSAGNGAMARILNITLATVAPRGAPRRLRASSAAPRLPESLSEMNPADIAHPCSSVSQTPLSGPDLHHSLTSPCASGGQLVTLGAATTSAATSHSGLSRSGPRRRDSSVHDGPGCGLIVTADVEADESRPVDVRARFGSQSEPAAVPMPTVTVSIGFTGQDQATGAGATGDGDDGGGRQDVATADESLPRAELLVSLDLHPAAHGLVDSMPSDTAVFCREAFHAVRSVEAAVIGSAPSSTARMEGGSGDSGADTRTRTGTETGLKPAKCGDHSRGASVAVVQSFAAKRVSPSTGARTAAGHGLGQAAAWDHALSFDRSRDAVTPGGAVLESGPGHPSSPSLYARLDPCSSAHAHDTAVINGGCGGSAITAGTFFIKGSHQNNIDVNLTSKAAAAAVIGPGSGSISGGPTHGSAAPWVPVLMAPLGPQPAVAAGMGADVTFDLTLGENARRGGYLPIAETEDASGGSRNESGGLCSSGLGRGGGSGGGLGGVPGAWAVNSGAQSAAATPAGGQVREVVKMLHRPQPSIPPLAPSSSSSLSPPTPLAQQQAATSASGTAAYPGSPKFSDGGIRSSRPSGRGPNSANLMAAVGVLATAASAPSARSHLGLPSPREEVALPANHHSTECREGEFQWHEVTLTRFLHPELKQEVIMVVQNDVSARIWAERQLVRVVEAEHTLLENIFPHHVIEHIATTAAKVSSERNTPDLAVMNARLSNTAAMGAGLGGWSTAGGGGGGGGGGVAGGGVAGGWEAGVPDRLPTIRGDSFLHLATSHSAITVLFCDIQGFTPMCKEVRPVVVMAFLNDLFTRLDSLLDEYGVYKVETIGDCYVAAGGLMKVDETGAVTVRSDDVDPQHAYNTVQFAKALLHAASRVPLPTTGEPVRLRVGIHSGPAMSGVVGTRMPRFCLFGDTMNTASRMESTGVPGAIHVSQATRDLVPEEVWEPTGGVQVKGKGCMDTFLLRPSA